MDDKFKKLLGGLGQFAIPKIEPVMPAYEMLDPNRKKYHSPAEILDEDSD